MNPYGYHITNDSIAAHHAWVFPKLVEATATPPHLQRLKDRS